MNCEAKVDLPYEVPITKSNDQTKTINSKTK